MSEMRVQAYGQEIAKAYEKGDLCGWAEVRNPGIAKEQFMLLDAKGAFTSFNIAGQTRATAGRKMFLWEVVRKVLGQDTKNYPQGTGDCVSFGAKNATEYLTCSQILSVAMTQQEMSAEDYIKAGRIKFRYVFPPYYYGTGRVYIGKGRLGNEAGSLGSWMADAVKEYGTLFADAEGVPAYNGRLADQWGAPNAGRILDGWKPKADEYDVKSAAQIKSWDEFVAAICNGYPCTTASNYGYSMEPGRDGFHAQTAQWGHQMCFVGVDDEHNDPYGVLLNSWGDVHGELKDFYSGEPLPKGTLRIRRKDVEKHIRAGELFAFSQFVGFPEQNLDKSLFMLI